MKEIIKKIAKVLILCAWVIVAFYGIEKLIAILLVHIVPNNWLTQPFWTTIYAALSYSISLAVIIFIPWKLFKEKTTREELGLKGLPTWTDLGLAPAGFIVYLFLAGAILSIFSQLFPWFDMSEAQETGFDNLVFGFDRIVALIALVVIAPIAEEIVFRGWFYAKTKKVLMKKTGKKKIKELPVIVTATLLVSAVFGLLHGQWNVGINVFAMSLVLCALREITGTIHAGILLHMIKNAVAFYLLYIML